MLYSVTILPIEILFRYLLDILYSVTDNYGVAIITLSVVINTILIPAYLLADKMQQKDMRIRKNMQPKIDEFKEAFQGTSRFMYIRTLYKIHRYHPIMALRSIGGLLIQVPFFIAAYQFLSHYELLEGVQFLFVNDLLQPDRLLSIGRMHINILPIIMTTLNIISAYIYTRRQDAKAMIQSWGLALMFLALLYKSPSGVVLYWTINNLYSLVKNLLLEKRSNAAILTVHNVFKVSVHTLLSNKRLLAIITGSGLIISWYLFATYMMYVTDRTWGEVPVTILYISGAISIFLCLLFCKIVSIQHKDHKITSHPSLLYPSIIHRRYRILPLITKIAVYGWLCVAGILLLYNILIPESLVAYDDYSSVDDAIRRGIAMRRLLAFIGVLGLNMLMVPSVLKYTGTHSKHALLLQKKKSQRALLVIVVCSIILSLMLIGVNIPLEVYNSDPDVWSNTSFFSLFLLISKYILIGLLLCITLYLVTPKTYKPFMASIMAGGWIIVCAFSYMLPFSYGVVNNFQLQEPERLLLPVSGYVIEGITLYLVIYVTYRLLVDKRKWLMYLAVVSVSIIIIQGTRSFIEYKVVTHEMNMTHHQEKISERPEYKNAQDYFRDSKNNMFNFSKNGKNIVVVLLDMFGGGYMYPILQNNPEIQNIFDGFVWYPNTLSISDATNTSIPSIYGGWNYIHDAIKNTKGSNVSEKIHTMYDELFSFFKSHKYDISYWSIVDVRNGFSTCENIKSRTQCVATMYDMYARYWSDKHGITIADNDLFGLSEEKRGLLLMVTGLLRSVPFFLKDPLYDEGSWNLFSYPNVSAYYQAVDEFAFLDIMADISNTQETGNTLKLFHDSITHTPFALDEMCIPRMHDFPYDQDTSTASYYSNLCAITAIGTWLEWLQQQDVYENTKIIIFSDHGIALPDPMPHEVPNVFAQRHGGRNDAEVFGKQHALLLVKDYNSNGVLQIDEEHFMSNTDVRALMCEDATAVQFRVQCSSDEDTTKILPVTRTLPTYVYGFNHSPSDWLQSDNFRPPQGAYEITDNIFKADNWKRKTQ